MLLFFCFQVFEWGYRRGNDPAHFREEYLSQKDHTFKAKVIINYSILRGIICSNTSAVIIYIYYIDTTGYIFDIFKTTSLTIGPLSLQTIFSPLPSKLRQLVVTNRIGTSDSNLDSNILG